MELPKTQTLVEFKQQTTQLFNATTTPADRKNAGLQKKTEPVPDRSEIARSPIEWTLNELENLAQFHGVAYINVTPLLYPGGQQIRGAYQVHAFNESEIEERTRFRSVALDAVRQVFGFAPPGDVLKKLRQSSTQLSAPVTSNNASSNKRGAALPGGGGKSGGAKDDTGSKFAGKQPESHATSGNPGRHNNNDASATGAGGNAFIRTTGSADNIGGAGLAPGGGTSTTNVHSGGPSAASGSAAHQNELSAGNNQRGAGSPVADHGAANATHHSDSPLEEHATTVANISIPAGKTAASRSAETGGNNPQILQQQLSDGGSGPTSTFDDYKTYVTVEIQLHRPLVARREAEELSAEVATYLPQRGSLPPVESDSKKAHADFKDTINHCVKLMIADYVDMLQTRQDVSTKNHTKHKSKQRQPEIKMDGDLSENDDATAAASDGRPKSRSKHKRSWRKKTQKLDMNADRWDPTLGFGLPKPVADEDHSKFLSHMNTSGKFAMLKDALKAPVLKLMKYRFPAAVNLRNEREREDFCLRLYIYLVDEARSLLEAIFRDNLEEVAPPKSLLNIGPEQMRIFADEAEINGDFGLALKHHQQRIAISDKEPQYWCEYAALLLRLKRIAEAEECLREALSLNRKHFATLLTLAYIAMHESKYPMAETLFEATTAFHPKSVIAWTVMGLFYEKLGDHIGIERSFHQAKRVVAESRTAVAAATTAAAAASTTQPLSWDIDADGDDSDAARGSIQSSSNNHNRNGAENPETTADRLQSGESGNVAVPPPPPPLPSIAIGLTVSSVGRGSRKSHPAINYPGGATPSSAADEDFQPQNLKFKPPAKEGNKKGQDLGAPSVSGAAAGASAATPAASAEQTTKKSGKKSTAANAAAAVTGAPIAGTSQNADNNNASKARRKPINEPSNSEISIFHMSAEFLLRIHAYPLIEQCLSHMMLDNAAAVAAAAAAVASTSAAAAVLATNGGNSEAAATTVEDSTAYSTASTSVSNAGYSDMSNECCCDTYHLHITAARLALARKEYDEAERRLQQALQMSMQDPFAMALLGHVYYLRGEFQVALEKYEWALKIKDTSAEFMPELHALLLRYADICMRQAQKQQPATKMLYDRAKRAYLTLSRSFPSCSSWLGVGIACYYLNELRNAENALAEANILDHLDARPWAYLTLICLKQKRFWEAEETFIQAVKCGWPTSSSSSAAGVADDADDVDGNSAMLTAELKRALDAAGIALPTVAAAAGGGNDNDENTTTDNSGRNSGGAAKHQQQQLRQPHHHQRRRTTQGSTSHGKKPNVTISDAEELGAVNENKLVGSSSSATRRRRPTGWVSRDDLHKNGQSLHQQHMVTMPTDDESTITNASDRTYADDTSAGAATGTSTFGGDDFDDELDTSSYDGVAMYQSGAATVQRM